MNVVKTVVLARGLGTRMREGGGGLSGDQAAAADRGAKAMMPLAPADGSDAPAALSTAVGPGRPRRSAAIPMRPVLLDYILSALADAGYESICLVVAPDHDAVRHRYEVTVPPTRFTLDFAVQEAPLGTADAVRAAGAFIDGDNALIINGDNYYPVPMLAQARMVGGPAVVLSPMGSLLRASNIPERRVRSFAMATVDAEGYLAELVEKPEAAAFDRAGKDPLISMNCWIMPPVIVDACRAITPSVRGELELQHAVVHAMRALHVRFRAIVSHEGVLDLSRRTDVAEVARRLAPMSPRL